MLYSVTERRYQRITSGGAATDWLPDSRRLIYRDECYLKLVDRVTGRTRKIGSVDDSRLHAPVELCVAADGRAIYSSRALAEGDIWLMTLE